MIENNIAVRTMDQRTRVKIFDATNSKRLSILHSSGAGKFRFRSRIGRCRSLRCAVEMSVTAVALDGHAASLANSMFERGDGLLLWRGRAGHVENFFFDDCPMEIISAV